jgi:BRCT domain type II-containing protein
MAIHAAVEARDAGLGRLAYDALKRHASKLVPKVYGDKTEVVVAGANNGPVQVERVA